VYRQKEKNLLKQQYLPTHAHNMVNVGPLTAEIGWRVLGTPAKISGFGLLPSLLHDVWPSSGRYTIYTFSGALAPAEFCQVQKFTLRPCLAFSYTDSVTARRSSSGRQPNCGVVSTCDRAAIPFDTGAVELPTVILYRNMCENATGLQ